MLIAAQNFDTSSFHLTAGGIAFRSLVPIDSVYPASA